MDLLTWEEGCTETGVVKEGRLVGGRRPVFPRRFYV